jgi:hypothetical protein
MEPVTLFVEKSENSSFGMRNKREEATWETGRERQLIRHGTRRRSEIIVSN